MHQLRGPDRTADLVPSVRLYEPQLRVYLSTFLSSMVIFPLLSDGRTYPLTSKSAEEAAQGRELVSSRAFRHSMHIVSWEEN
jgi:hypothetical protein